MLNVHKTQMVQKRHKLTTIMQQLQNFYMKHQLEFELLDMDITTGLNENCIRPIGSDVPVTFSVVGYVFPYRFNVQIEIKIDSRSVFHKEFKNGRWQIF